MRIVFCVSVLAMLAAAACTPDGAVDPGDSGTGDPDADAAPTCTAGFSDELLHITTSSSSRQAVATGDGFVGVAYTDQTGGVSLGLMGPDGTAATHPLTAPLNRTKYKNYFVSLAYAQGHFGVGFDFERTTTAPNLSDPNNWPSVGFTSVNATTGKPSDPLMANNDLDRTGGSGGEPVQAWAPVAIPTSKGFFVEWSDMRTAEPTQYNVNLADWTGLYGFGFNLDGSTAMAEDVQVMQIDQPYGFSGVTTSKGVLAAWGGRDSNNSEAWLYTRLGPANGQFTPATPNAPIVTVPGGFFANSVTAALGNDGKVLLVFEVSSNTTHLSSLYAVLVDASGKLVTKTKLADDPKKSFGLATIAPTSSGYVVAYASGPYSYTTGTAAWDTIRTASIDATGATSNALATPLDAGTLQGNLAVVADDTGRAVVDFLSGATPDLAANADRVSVNQRVHAIVAPARHALSNAAFAAGASRGKDRPLFSGTRTACSWTKPAIVHELAGSSLRSHAATQSFAKCASVLQPAKLPSRHAHCESSRSCSPVSAVSPRLSSCAACS